MYTAIKKNVELLKGIYIYIYIYIYNFYEKIYMFK
jgi:hypothetical protein